MMAKSRLFIVIVLLSTTTIFGSACAQHNPRLLQHTQLPTRYLSWNTCWFPISIKCFTLTPIIIQSRSYLIESMNVDRNKNTVEIHLKNGSVINESFTARPEQDWPSGCPANLGSTKMEVLGLDVDKLVIGSLINNSPVLVRNCPRSPEKVFLREDGQIGGSGTACSGTETCIHFQPGSPIDSNPSSIFP